MKKRLVVAGCAVTLAAALGLAALWPTPSGKSLAQGAYSLLLPIVLRSYEGAGPPPQLFFGVYADRRDKPALEKVLDMGATALRVTVEWARLHPYPDYTSQGAYQEYDEKFANLAAAGITPIVMVWRAPDWAADRERGPLKPGMLPAYTQFLVELVRRYSVPPYNVRHWELWAEPDAMDILPEKFAADPGNLHRRAWGDHGADFAQMLKAAYAAIKGADPHAQVALGALGYDWFGENCPGFNCGGIFNYRFLDDVLQAGGGNYFDIFAFNSYIFFAPEWEARNPGKDIIAKTNHLRRKLAEYGLSKPMLVLEAGFWSAGDTVPLRLDSGEMADLPPSPQAQADYVVKVYSRARAAGLLGVYWYTLADYTIPEYGLMDANLFPKPAFFAYRNMTSKLGGTSYVGLLAPISASGPAEGYTFSRADGRRIAVLWSAGTGTVTVTVPIRTRNAWVTDIKGGTLSVGSAPGGRLTLTVGPSPLYVEEMP